MHVQWTERIFAASIPVTLVILNYAASTSVTLVILNFVAALMVILVPVAFYFISKKLGFSFAADHALRIFDLLVSVMVVAFVVGLLITGVSIAARDGGVSLAILEGDLVHNLLYSALTVYTALAVLLHLVFASLGKEFKMPLALRPFEALRGKNNSNESSKKDALKRASS